MARHGYLTPETIPATTTRRWICFPDEQYILAAVNGALMELTYSYNWELFGAITPDEISAALLPYVLDFQATLGECQLLSAAPVLLSDVKTQNTAGGTATAGSWFTRDLNTLVDPAGIGVTLVGNEFTVPAGLVLVEWTVPAYQVAGFQSRLFSVSDGTPAGYGSTEISNAGVAAQTHSRGAVYQDNDLETEYRIEQRVATTQTVNGRGRPANLAEEIYTQVKVTLLS